MQAESSDSQKGPGLRRGRDDAGNRINNQPQPAKNKSLPQEETARVPCTPPQPRYATPDTPPLTGQGTVNIGIEHKPGTKNMERMAEQAGECSVRRQSEMTGVPSMAECQDN